MTNDELKVAIHEAWGTILVARDRRRNVVDHGLLARLNAKIAVLRQWPKDHEGAGLADLFCDEASESAWCIERGAKDREL